MANAVKPLTLFNNTTADANDVEAIVNVLYATINSLDDANIATAAGIAWTKISKAGAVPADIGALGHSVITSDPGSPAVGNLYYRSDLGLYFYKGAAVPLVILPDNVNFLDFVEEFQGVNISDRWSGHITSSGSIALGSATGEGYAELSTGTTSGGAYLLDFFDSALFACANSSNLPIVLETKVRITGAVTNCLARAALATDGTPNGNNSIYFEFDPSASANWRCISKNGATAQTTTTSVAVNVNQDYHLRAIFKSGEVKFYVDGVLVATHTTQVPASAIPMAPSFKIETTNTTDKKLRVYKSRVIAKN